jgi:hypothetical protein
VAFNAEAVLYGRDFKVYRAPWDDANILPANTVLYGTDWAQPATMTETWVEVGYTDGGLNFNIEIPRSEIRVDQSLDPIARPATGRNMTLECALAEFTVANIASAAGQGTVTTVAATTAARGYNELLIDPDIDDEFISVGYDIKHQDDEAFRIVGWKTQPSGGVSGTISAEDNATINFAVTCFPDTSTTPDRVLTIRDIIPISA